MAAPALVLKAAASILTNETSRKAVGWALAAVLSPIILLLAFFCTTFSGGAEHNRTVVDLCFHGGTIPEDTPAEYQAYIQEMRDSFALLDAAMRIVEGQMEDGDGLDDVWVKAVFFALYFGADDPAARAGQAFVDCFATYEERTRTVTTVDEDGNEVETQETYTVAVPISDLQQVWQNIRHLTGAEATPEQQANADSVYNVVKYGASTGTEGWIPGTDVPFIGADGFCSPIGAGWESRVTSEFGYRRDPFTGETRGHTGMDLAVPTGTPRPGGPARHRHRRPVTQQLRLLCDDRPRQRPVHPLCPQLPTAGAGGSNGGGRRHRISVRQHRPVYRPPPPLQGTGQRTEDRSQILSARDKLVFQAGFQLRQTTVSGILRIRKMGGMDMTNMNQARLEELASVISRAVTVEQIYLFGSYAYGTPNEDSDLDLYVVIPDGNIPPAEAVKRIRRALYPVQDMPMDVIACRVSTFRQRQQGPSLERTVARKGVLLYGQPEPEQRMA